MLAKVEVVLGEVRVASLSLRMATDRVSHFLVVYNRGCCVTILDLPSISAQIQHYFLFRDKFSLAACALVCKDWVPSGRYHLSRVLEFDLDDQDAHIIFEGCPRRCILYVRKVKLWSYYIQSTTAIRIVVELFPRLRTLSLYKFIWNPLVPLPQFRQNSRS